MKSEAERCEQIQSHTYGEEKRERERQREERRERRERRGGERKDLKNFKKAVRG